LSGFTADGWLLVTLWFAGPVTRRDPAAWRHVVATADWINHAILSYEEASAGVRSLARRGLLVERANGVLVLSPAARKGFAAAYGTRKRMGVFKLWDVADAVIARQKPRASTVRGPTRAVYRRALQSYGVALPDR
jgi:hypothetical protein